MHAVRRGWCFAARMRLKFKAAKVKFYLTTKIKFARHEGRISFAAKDKILSAKIGAVSAQSLREMKFKDRASYTRMPMYTAHYFSECQIAV